MSPRPEYAESVRGLDAREFRSPGHQFIQGFYPIPLISFPLLVQGTSANLPAKWGVGSLRVINI